MTDYGLAPAHDEVELSVFGPGYGEAIAVHLGEGAWVLVDSCLDPETRCPATLSYLNSIGVSAESVKAILASHWHDDHVRGIAALARAFPAAEFHLSAVFNTKEALTFVAAYSGQVATNLNRGTKELYTAIDERGGKCHFVQQRSTILDLPNYNQQIRVTALSPVPTSFSRFLADITQYVPSKDGGEPINNIVPLRQNFESIALHIDFGDDAILLGADLEDHTLYGWSAVVSDSWVSGRRKASALKVAHHGSSTGDSPAIWTTLVEGAPIAALTPYNNGKVKLPSASDILRLKGRTSSLWLTSGAARKPQLPLAQLKRLDDIATNVVPINNGFGCVRLRRRKGCAWQAECFGSAQKL